MHKLLTLTLATLLSTTVVVYAEEKSNTTDATTNTPSTNTGYQFTEEKKPIADEQLTYIQAIKLGKIDIIKQHLDKGIKVDDKQDGRFTGLFFASAKGYADIVELLISHGADVNVQGRGAWTPLIGATFHAHIANIKLLAAGGAKLELQSSDGLSALMYAATYGKEDVTALLIKLGANVNASSHAKHMKGKSVLSHAIDKEQLAAAQILLKAGAKADSEEGSGRTPLIYAANKNNTELIQLLLDNGAKINRRDQLGNSPLHRLAKRAKPETLQYILDKGADNHIKNKEGKTALEVAAGFGNTDNMVVLASKATQDEKEAAFFASAQSGLTKGVETLLELGQDINTRNAKQETALMIAAIKRHHLLVDKLLELNADISANASNGRNALMYGCTASPLKQIVIEALLKKDFDINQQDKKGDTALLLALKSANGITPELVSLLLKAGANTNIKNNRGLNAKSVVEQQLTDNSFTAAQKENLEAIAALL